MSKSCKECNGTFLKVYQHGYCAAHHKYTVSKCMCLVGKTPLEQCKAKIDTALREFNFGLVVIHESDDEPPELILSNGLGGYVPLELYPGNDDGDYYCYDGKNERE